MSKANFHSQNLMLKLASQSREKSVLPPFSVIPIQQLKHFQEKVEDTAEPQIVIPNKVWYLTLVDFGE